MTKGHRGRIKIDQYDSAYIKSGFTYKLEDVVEMPLCFICGAELANSSMFPEKLSRHLSSSHKDLKANDEHFWEKSKKKFCTILSPNIVILVKKKFPFDDIFRLFNGGYIIDFLGFSQKSPKIKMVSIDL